MASKHPQGKRNAVCGHLWPKAERGCSVQGNHLLGGGQHRVCLVCGNAAARLPHEFRAEARTHFIYVWGDRIFEKCGIRRDEEGDGGKTLEIRGKRRLSARDGGANYQQS